MTNKKWIYTTLLLSTLLYLFMIILYIIVDAEIVFNQSITHKKFGYTEYYSKYQYEKLKHNKYSLIFGTSRSQKLSSKELNINLLNLHNIYGEPEGILNFLSQLDKNQIQNITHIYYLVSIDTMVDEPPTINYKSNSFFDKLYYVLPLSDLSIKYTLRDLKYNFAPKSIYYYISDDGSLFVHDKNQSSILNQRTVLPSSINKIIKTKSIDTLLKINEFCKKNNIAITYYTPTYSNKVIINTDTIKFLWTQLLNGGVKNFYATYYIDGVSDLKLGNSYECFTDGTHLNYTYMNKVFKDTVLDEDKRMLISNTQELDKYITTLNKKLKSYELQE